MRFLMILVVALVLLPASAFAQYHRIPQYPTVQLPLNPPVGSQAVVTDGLCAGTLLEGDGTNWRSKTEKEQRIINVACPPYSAVADGATDTTAALLAAIAALPVQGGTLYFPCPSVTAAYYKITATLDFTGKNQYSIVGGCTPGSGQRGAFILGAIVGDLIKLPNSRFRIDSMGLRNTDTNTTSNVINLAGSGTATAEISHSFIAASSAIGLNGNAGNNFNLTIRDTQFSGSGNTGIGLIMGGSPTILYNVDFSGWLEGLRVWGAGFSIFGGRFEVNTTAMVLGQKQDGSTSAVSIATFAGIEMEANDTFIKAVSCTACTFQNISMSGSVNAPSGQSIYGFDLRACSQCTFTSLALSGSFRGGVIRDLDASGENRIWSGVKVVNTYATNPATWNNSAGLGPNRYSATNYLLRPQDDTVTATNLSRHGTFQWFGAIDYMHAMVEGKNMGARDVAVTAGATSLAIAFNADPVQATFKVSTATAIAGGTLVEGTTYFYCGITATPHGEMTPGSAGGCAAGGNGEVSCAPAVGNDSCQLTFPSGAAYSGTLRYRRRVYRRTSADGSTSSGPYAGYFELGTNSDATFTDSGQALTANKDTSRIDDASMIEPDANYAVLCTTNWNTNCYETAKATTGFTLNFSTPAPVGNGTVDYFIVRLPGGANE